MPYINVYFNNELKFTRRLTSIITRIGRHAGNDIVIDNAGVSGNHAIIVEVGDKYFIHDKRSTNGVYVNGVRITEKELNIGDEIGIFKHKLKFSAIDSPLTVTGSSTEISKIPQNATVEIDISKLDELLKKSVAQNAYLNVLSGKMKGEKFKVSTAQFTIGKANRNDINMGGWLTPDITAKIVRQSDGYYLIPIKRAKARHNGRLINTRVKLKHDDKFEIRGTKFYFSHKS